MSYPFHVDRKYSRRDVRRILGLSEDIKGGNWDTGYVRHGNDYFIFTNIGTPGRTGHDYKNYWDGDTLVWYGKTGTHAGQPAIQRMTAGAGDVYVFWREDNQGPFTFAGFAHAEHVEETSPVKVSWVFTPISAGSE
jgi:5-methylcytosine-specific restriction enzyme A